MGKRLLRAAACLAAVCLWAAPASALVRMSETTDSFAIPNSGFVSGCALPFHSEDELVVMDISIGNSGVATMSNGEWMVGTGIVGSGQAATPNLDSAHPYPNPYMPSKGHASVTFTHLPTQVTIRVYTLAGELVQEMSKNNVAADQVAWQPVNNKQGQPLASGVYLYTIAAADGQTKTGKFMVIR